MIGCGSYQSDHAVLRPTPKLVLYRSQAI